MPIGIGEGLSVCTSPDIMSVCADVSPLPGGPFSALTPSMWPQDILCRLSQVRATFDLYLFNELGCNVKSLFTSLEKNNQCHERMHGKFIFILNDFKYSTIQLYLI